LAAARSPLTTTNPSHARLNLRENELESAGASTIARALPSLPALSQLDLAANQISRAGAQAVARALVSAGRRSFERLVLDENYLTDEAVEGVSDLLTGAFGGADCLSAEELDPDAAEDDEEDEEGGDEGMDDGAGDELAAALERGARI
jgi:Ran GTPase-activating protein 1